jgi:hypothetical protein
VRLVACALVVAAGVAHADGAAAPDDRCRRGIDAAQRGDLAAAAFYLDHGCARSDDTDRVRAKLAARLEASQLARVEIVTSQTVAASISAFPGETFSAPTTLWLRGGRYEVRVWRDAAATGEPIVRALDIQPRTRVPIIIEVAPPKAAPPKVAVANFDDEAAQIEQGPPKPAEHPPLLPCKYRGECPASGEAISDPLEPRVAVRSDALAMRARFGVRAGVGINLAARGGYTIGAIGTFALTERFAAVARADFVQRIGTMDTLEAVAVGGGAAARIATGRAFAITAGLDARGEVRFESSFAGRGVDRFGFAGDAVLDVVMRRMPLVIGARLQRDFAGVVDSQRATIGLIELAVELR